MLLTTMLGKTKAVARFAGLRIFVGVDKRSPRSLAVCGRSETRAYSQPHEIYLRQLRPRGHGASVINSTPMTTGAELQNLV